MSHQTKEGVGPTKEQTETTDAVSGNKTRRTEAKINSQYETRAVTLQDLMRV